MDKVTISSRADSKANYVVSSQAAATLTIGAGELGIGIGTNVRDAIQLRGFNGIGALKDALREVGWPVDAANPNYAYGTPPITSVTIGNAVSIPALTEDDVAIFYGTSFYDGSNSHVFDTHIDRALEVYLEQVGKLN